MGRKKDWKTGKGRRIIMSAESTAKVFIRAADAAQFHKNGAMERGLWHSAIVAMCISPGTPLRLNRAGWHGKPRLSMLSPLFRTHYNRMDFETGKEEEAAMMEETRTIGYICPSCGQAVLEERTVFGLSAGKQTIHCPCGKSALTVETDGLQYRVQVPCGVCGGEHTAQVSADAMLRGQGIALSCPKTRQHCCCIGEGKRVRPAVRELAIAAEKWKRQQEEPEAFVDGIIMYEILSEIKDIAQRGGVSCGCGSTAYGVEIRPGAVDLVCRSCGAKLRLPAATDEDLDALCCQVRLQIPGRPAK